MSILITNINPTSNEKDGRFHIYHIEETGQEVNGQKVKKYMTIGMLDDIKHLELETEYENLTLDNLKLTRENEENITLRIFKLVL